MEKGPCKEDDDFDHWGADITHFKNVPSSSACCDRCKTNPACKSWTWGKIGGKWSKTCWIKNKKFGSSGKRGYKPGLISGQPSPRPPPPPPPPKPACPECGNVAIESLQFPGSYLDAGGDRKVWTAPKHYSLNNYRKWKIIDIGGGKRAIESLQFPGSYLDAGGNRKVWTAQKSYDYNNYRKWKINDIGGGKVAIESLQFPKSYLDAGGDRKVWTAPKSLYNNYRKWKILKL